MAYTAQFQRWRSSSYGAHQLDQVSKPNTFKSNLIASTWFLLSVILEHIFVSLFTHIITIDCCGIPHHDHYPHQHNRQVFGKKQKEAKINNDSKNNWTKRSTSALSAGLWEEKKAKINNVDNNNYQIKRLSSSTLSAGLC